jgi:cytochrome c-type biogenesis protein CcsB
LEQAGKGSSGFGTDLAGVLNRIDQYQAIVGGSDWLVLNAEGQWTKISEIQAAGDPGAVERNVMASLERVSTSERQGMQIETLYEKTHPFSVAILLGLLSFVASLAVGRFPRAGRFALALIGLTLLVEGYGIVLRVLISGRAPVTNMFETVMWVGLCALGLSALLGTKLKNAQVWSVGIAVNLVALFMMLFATRMLDGGIQPLVPVLRDNFWLSTHVTTITTSYACFAFAWLLSNAVLVRQILGYLSEEGLERWNYVARITIQIGTVFLAAGIILGGVWADYSWGRFWGWDPKETWSLIALIVHTGILHGRYTGWFKGIQFTRMAALGFLSIIMAWFGVNYILAVGLHSYGFSSGGAAMIAAVVGVQSVILAISWLRTRRTVLA